MKTERMSSLTRSLYRYECQYLNDAAQDKTLTGPIKASLAGRVILLAISFILHAEAVCRAVYICFLTIKQIFSQSTQELLTKQRGECTVAYDASLRSFVAALFYQKLITPLEENRSPSSAVPARITQPQMRPSQPTQQSRVANREETRIDIGSITSANDDLKDSDCLAPNNGSGPDFEYRSLSQPSHLRLDANSIAGSAAIIVDVDDCHFPESPEMQPLFGNLDAISLSGSPETLSPNLKPQVAQPDTLSHADSEPVLVDSHQPTTQGTKPQAAHLDLRSLAGSEPSLVNRDEANSPKAKPQHASLVVGSRAGSEPSLVDGHKPLSPKAKPQLANLDIRSLADSEPSLVDGDDGKDPVSPKAQLFANIDIRSHAGSEPSLINDEDCKEPNSPKAQPAKTSVASESEYIMVKQEDIDRMRSTMLESMRLGLEVDRIEEESQKLQDIQLELQLTKRQVDFLNKRLSRYEGNNALAGLDIVDHPSQDGELIEILNEFEKQEAAELGQGLPHTTASVKSFDILSRSSDPMPLIIEKEKSKTEAKAPESPRSQSSGEFV